MASNPFQRKTGMAMKVRMAYFDTLVRWYKRWPVKLNVQEDRLNIATHTEDHWKHVLNEYKKEAKWHNFGKVM